MNTGTITQPDEAQSITSYKAFLPDFSCRGFQYEVGKTYTHDHEIIPCQSGFHACQHPLEVLAYYTPGETRFALVEQSGKRIASNHGSPKIASEKISIIKELNAAELVEQAIELTARETPGRIQSNHETRGTTSAQEDYAIAETTGAQAISTATGVFGIATTCSDFGTAIVNNRFSAALARGTEAAAIATSEYSMAIVENPDKPYRPIAKRRNIAVVTGYRSLATAESTCSLAIASNIYCVASAMNTDSAALTSGRFGAAYVKGSNSVAIGIGRHNCVKAGNNSAIVLVYRDELDHIVHIRASKTGENGIKPDVWYELNEHGDFIESQYQSSYP